MPGGHLKKVAIIGLGGIGKTQIALELAHRTWDKYRGSSVFWVPALSREAVRKAFVDIGRQLNVPGLAEPEAEVFGIVQQRLSCTSTGQWLLIIDNADDAEMWFARAAADGVQAATRLIDYLPRSPLGAILITTRSRKVAVQMAGSEVLAVPDMDKLTAMDLLRKALITPTLLDIEGPALELLKQLAFLPLAIVQAAAYINANDISLAEYLSLFGEADGSAVELLSENFEDERRYPEAKNPIATTWLISLEQIRRYDPLAADYLSFMACVEPKSIPLSLLPQGKSRKTTLDAVGTLTAYSFVTKRPEGKFFDLHRLVHVAMHNWLKGEQQLARWNREVLIQLAKVFPVDDWANRESWRAYLPHARRILDQIAVPEHDEHSMLLLSRFSGCLREEGRYAEARASYKELVQAQLRHLGQEHPALLGSMSSLALACSYEGRWLEAEKIGVQVLERRRRVLGLEHPDTLTTMANLAYTYQSQGRFAAAEDLGVLVLAKRMRVLGREHPHTLTSMANLAVTYQSQGRFAEAEELGARALKMKTRVLGLEHPDTLTSMANFATVCSDQERWLEAEELKSRCWI